MTLEETEDITFRWRDIEVTATATDTVILQSMSGVAKPGRLLAIMGASGAGKTTLLNALTYRSGGTLKVDGHISVNARPFVGAEVQKVSAYVQQHDVFYGILTVREHLWLQAMLRMDQRIPKSEREKRVDNVIEELGLKEQAKTRIGDPDTAKSLSGGERKRLSLASEILMNPSLLFCDEPTSGLDSFMAENVVNTLLGMAKKGKTIVCTIHQPSSNIFGLFDDLLLVAKGRLAYLGPLDEADGWFDQQGHPCPSHFNPAEHFLTTLSMVPGKEEDSRNQINRLCDAFDDSHFAADIREEVAPKGKEDQGAMTQAEVRQRPNYLTEFRYIGWRAFIVEFRDIKMFLFKTAPLIFMSAIMGVIYLLQDNNQKGVQNLGGAMFLFSALACYTNGFAVAVSLPLEFPTLRRDIQNQMHSVFVYFTSKNIVELIIFSVLMFISATIVYWLMGFRQDAEAWLIFTATIVFMTDVAIGYSYMIPCATANILITSAVFAPLVIPWMMFGGFVLNDDSIPKYVIWMEYLSWFKYSNSILMANQWEQVTHIDCEFATSAGGQDNSISPVVSDTVVPNNSTLAPNASSTTTPPTAPPEPERSLDARCYRNGTDVLIGFSYNEDYWARDFACLTALFIGFRTVACILLYFQMHGIEWLILKFRRPKNKPKKSSKAVDA